MDRDRSGHWCQRLDALRPAIKQYQECRFWLYQARRPPPDTTRLCQTAPLAAEICSVIESALRGRTGIWIADGSVFRAQPRFDALDQLLPQRRHHVSEDD